jgi:3D (Asp-Asp-Asp) domain-containing protein
MKKSRAQIAHGFILCLVFELVCLLAFSAHSIVIDFSKEAQQAGSVTNWEAPIQPPPIVCNGQQLTFKPHSPRLIPVLVEVTGYCACQLCCPGGVGLTSRGIKCSEHPWGVAVAPNMISYGTRLFVPGYHNNETVIADDTGGAMRQAASKGIVAIDLRFPSHQEALNWGRKKMTVYIVEQ